jgi:Protein of unknown function (DUF2971)
MGSTNLHDTDLIYHYCPAETFVKIIESGVLWITNIFFMNDSLEYFWLQRLIKKRIDEELNAADRRSRKILMKLRKRFSEEEPSHIYCCCFSEKRDLLSQWRSYASDGTGYALGFSKTAMAERIPQEHKPYFKLSKIKYTEEEHDHAVKLALSGLSASDFEDQQPERSEFTESFGAHFAAQYALSAMASECKNPAFDEEQEWRLIYSASTPRKRKYDEKLSAPPPISSMKFVARGGQLVPHFEYGHLFDPKLDDHRRRRSAALKHIVLGPRNRSPENKFSIRLLLEENGFDPDQIEITRSKASYR